MYGNTCLKIDLALESQSTQHDGGVFSVCIPDYCTPLETV